MWHVEMKASEKPWEMHMECGFNVEYGIGEGGWQTIVSEKTKTFSIARISHEDMLNADS